MIFKKLKKDYRLIKYEVIVQIDDITIFLGNKRLKRFSKLLKKAKLKGEVYRALAIAQGHPTLGVVKRFFLTDPTDFQTFNETVKMLEGVTGVHQGSWPVKEK